MSSIYLHIPFCKQACIYCDFHFSTQLNYTDDFVDALCKEINIRNNYLANKKLKTIYFGGGTPSILTKDQISKIIDTLQKYYTLEKDIEITLEANPDDINKDKLKDWRDIGINRLSIGTQSFIDEDLKILNRAHNAQQADYSIKSAQDKGFENITIDLIYGLPGSNSKKWEFNLNTFLSLQIPHLSAYCLTVEPKTVLAHKVKNKLITVSKDDESAKQFLSLVDFCERNKIIQYEISNFCKEGFYSRHNSNYWKNNEYLGLGPSAHSFNGSSRQWNVSNNHIYINSLLKNEVKFEKEELSKRDLYNEYIMTSLRTMWGVDERHIGSKFGSEYQKHFSDSVKSYADDKYVLNANSTKFILSKEGKLIADKIASDLFMVEGVEDK